MKILFITLAEFNSLQQSGIYTDLLREFVKRGHQVFGVSPTNDRKSRSIERIEEKNAVILRPSISSVQKTNNIIKKGVSTLRFGQIIKKTVRKYFSDVHFNLVLYPTPPVTLAPAVEYVKRRDRAGTYLLLKDIFPQNAVDIGMMSSHGLKGMIYKYFRTQERRLYAVSDKIGCMSTANVEYVLKHNPEIEPSKLEVCPNSIEIIDKSVDSETRERIRKQYGIPLNKTVFVYGGNLGKPQGIPFLIECLQQCRDLEDIFFLIVGSGTEYGVLEDYIDRAVPDNVRLMKSLPKEVYDTLVGSCDVGLIFLDHRFTIPNFPSRMLSYMQAKLPVLACTDSNTDVGQVIVDGGFGWWCESSSPDNFRNTVIRSMKELQPRIRENSYSFLVRNYSVSDSCEMICRAMK